MIGLGWRSWSWTTTAQSNEKWVVIGDAIYIFLNVILLALVWTLDKGCKSRGHISDCRWPTEGRIKWHWVLHPQLTQHSSDYKSVQDKHTWLELDMLNMYPWMLNTLSINYCITFLRLLVTVKSVTHRSALAWLFLTPSVEQRLASGGLKWQWCRGFFTS